MRYTRKRRSLAAKKGWRRRRKSIRLGRKALGRAKQFYGGPAKFTQHGDNWTWGLP